MRKLLGAGIALVMFAAMTGVSGADHNVNWSLSMGDVSVQYSDLAGLSGNLSCAPGTGHAGTCPSLDGATVTVEYKDADDNWQSAGTATTNADGSWSTTATWQADLLPAQYNNGIRAYATGGNTGVSSGNSLSSGNKRLTVTKEGTTTAYTGGTSGAQGSSITLNATVQDADTSVFTADENLAGKVTFQLYASDGTTAVGSAVEADLADGALTSTPSYALPSTPGTYKMKASYGGNDYYQGSVSALADITVTSLSDTSGRAGPAVANDYIDNTLTQAERDTCKAALGKSWRGQLIRHVAHTYNPKPFVDAEVFADIREMCGLS